MDLLKKLLSFLTSRKLIVAPSQVKDTEPEIKPAPTRKWRLTYYWVAEQARHTGSRVVPVYSKDGVMLDRVEPAYFAEMSLQGTGKMRDGRLFNVAGKRVAVKHEDYALVWEHHKRYLNKRPPGYSGLRVVDDKVVEASAYRVVPPETYGMGFGTLRGVPLEPFRTLAADIGLTGKSEPKWKGKGGVCPPLTRVFILAFVGKICPDMKGGTFVHDGWFTVTDTGGGIFGKHFDVFVGTKSLVSGVKIPGQVDVTYDGIEARVPPDGEYSYGLHDV